MPTDPEPERVTLMLRVRPATLKVLVKASERAGLHVNRFVVGAALREALRGPPAQPARPGPHARARRGLPPVSDRGGIVFPAVLDQEGEVLAQFLPHDGAVAGVLVEEGDHAGAVLDVVGVAVDKPVHDRMPVMLAREDFTGRLDEAVLPGPFPAERMAARAVGPRVNNARNEGPGCLEPASAEGGP
jgi:hypothetical protein